MILFQEGQTVEIPPMYIWEDPPWHEKVFVLALLVLLIFVLIRDVQLLLSLRELRKLERRETFETMPWRVLWDQSLLRTHVLARFGVLTFFVTLFIVSVSMTAVFSAVRYEKTLGLGLVIFEISGKLPYLSFGMLVCALLYGSGFFFESRLDRYKLRFDRLQSAQRPKGDSAQSTD